MRFCHRLRHCGRQACRFDQLSSSAHIISAFLIWHRMRCVQRGRVSGLRARFRAEPTFRVLRTQAAHDLVALPCRAGIDAIRVGHRHNARCLARPHLEERPSCMPTWHCSAREPAVPLTASATSAPLALHKRTGPAQRLRSCATHQIQMYADEHGAHAATSGRLDPQCQTH